MEEGETMEHFHNRFSDYLGVSVKIMKTVYNRYHAHTHTHTHTHCVTVLFDTCAYVLGGGPGMTFTRSTRALSRLPILARCQRRHSWRWERWRRRCRL
jgi:hypothetical protein